MKPFMLALGATCCIGSSAVAQGTMTSAAAVGALIRTEHHAGNALDLLTQREGTESRATLDAIGDTLVAIALSQSSGDAADRSRRVAILTLALAGNGKGAIPYEGAAVTAVNLLGFSLGEPGRAGARELFRRNRVVSAHAKRTLDRLATKHGWRPSVESPSAA